MTESTFDHIIELMKNTEQPSMKFNKFFKKQDLITSDTKFNPKSHNNASFGDGNKSKNKMLVKRKTSKKDNTRCKFEYLNTGKYQKLLNIAQKNLSDMSRTVWEHVNLTEDNEKVVITLYDNQVAEISKKNGDIKLNSNGYRTYSTSVCINKILEPLGFYLFADDNKSKRWTVTNHKFYQVPFEDDMVIGTLEETCHAKLLARASVVAQTIKQKLASIRN